MSALEDVTLHMPRGLQNGCSFQVRWLSPLSLSPVSHYFLQPTPSGLGAEVKHISPNSFVAEAYVVAVYFIDARMLCAETLVFDVGVLCVLQRHGGSGRHSGCREWCRCNWLPLRDCEPFADERPPLFSHVPPPSSTSQAAISSSPGVPCAGCVVVHALVPAFGGTDALCRCGVSHP